MRKIVDRQRGRRCQLCAALIVTMESPITGLPTEYGATPAKGGGLLTSNKKHDVICKRTMSKRNRANMFGRKLA